MTLSIADLADLWRTFLEEAFTEGGDDARERAEARFRAHLNRRALERAVEAHPAGKERA